MDAATAALLGAGIGAVASLGAVWVQQHFQGKRDLLKSAAELASASFGQMLELAKTQGGTLPQYPLFVWYHAEVLRAISDGTFTPERARSLTKKHDELMAAMDEAAKN